MNWSTACPDWAERIVAGRPLISSQPLFPGEGQAALDVFKALRIVDAPGRPTFGDAGDSWIFDFVGAVFGAFSGGLPLGVDGEVAATGGALTRSLAALGSPAALVGAVAGVLLAGLLGATYLGLRTTGPVRDRARALAPVLAGLLLVPLGGAALAGQLPVAGAAAAAGVLALIAVLARAGREALAFAVTAVLVAAVTVAILAAPFPVLLASTLDPAWSVTVAGAAASPMALRTISIAGIVVLPGVIAYQAFAYWVFRKRVASAPVPT